MNAKPELRVLQITDCHVSAQPGTSYRGLDARAELERLLPAAQAWRPDVVLLTGDLAEDESEGAYAWLAETLASLGTPLLATPGNHDDPVLMQRYFERVSVDAPLVFDQGEWRLVLLNSARPGRIDGTLDDEQLSSLAAVLDAGPAHALVALHHQPVMVGSHWIDRYALHEPERLWSVLAGTGRCRAVCWGHVHQAFDQMVGSIRAMAGPSSAANSLPGQVKFTADGAGPACRTLHLSPDGCIDTAILRPPGPPKVP